MDPSDHDLVLVVDFGAQYAQLIARRVREAHVYSEIVSRSMPVAEMLARKPKAIILSGGPASVHVDGAPSIDPAIYASGVPLLGIFVPGCDFANHYVLARIDTFIHRNGFIAFALPKLHQRLIDCDSYDPGIKLAVALKLV